MLPIEPDLKKNLIKRSVKFKRIAALPGMKFVDYLLREDPIKNQNRKSESGPYIVSFTGEEVH